MIDYGKVESTIMPQELELKGEFVWIAENITPFTRPATDEIEEVQEGYEYHLTQYTKDEYILQKMQSDKLQTDIAMAELAMAMAGGVM